MKKIAIIGSGPAGVTSAISASYYSSEDVEIHVFEKNRELLRTILATGNGRCNFSNIAIDIDKYHNSSFVRSFNSYKQTNEGVCEILTSLGLEITTNDSGLMFPASYKASSVREVLLNSLKKTGAIVHTNTKTDINKMLDCFDAVIIATGHECNLSNVKVTSFQRKLCPIVTYENVSIANNVRCKVMFKVKHKNSIVFQEAGEVQFREYGISGIVTFNASRYVNEKDVIYLDFTYPCMVKGNVKEHFKCRFEQSLGNLSSFFQGYLHEKIAKLIISRVNNHNSFEALWKEISSFKLVVNDLYDEHELSQVSRGGIETCDVNPETMQIANTKGKLYACGEVVDVDGPCGGYNLSWAFESGWRAGKCVAKSLK